MAPSKSCLVLKRGVGASHGVVLLRTRLASPTELAHRVTGVLASRGDWAGNFSVVEGDRVRMPPLG